MRVLFFGALAALVAAGVFGGCVAEDAGAAAVGIEAGGADTQVLPETGTPPTDASDAGPAWDFCDSFDTAPDPLAPWLVERSSDGGTLNVIADPGAPSPPNVLSLGVRPINLRVSRQRLGQFPEGVVNSQHLSFQVRIDTLSAADATDAPVWLAEIRVGSPEGYVVVGARHAGGVLQYVGVVYTPDRGLTSETPAGSGPFGTWTTVDLRVPGRRADRDGGSAGAATLRVGGNQAVTFTFPSLSTSPDLRIDVGTTTSRDVGQIRYDNVCMRYTESQ